MEGTGKEVLGAHFVVGGGVGVSERQKEERRFDQLG